MAADRPASQARATLSPRVDFRRALGQRDHTAGRRVVTLADPTGVTVAR